MCNVVFFFVLFWFGFFPVTCSCISTGVLDVRAMHVLLLKQECRGSNLAPSVWFRLLKGAQAGEQVLEGTVEANV